MANTTLVSQPSSYSVLSLAVRAVSRSRPGWMQQPASARMSVRRRDVDTAHVALLISMLVLIFLASILLGTLVFLRSVRRTRKQLEFIAQLPVHERRQLNHNHLTIAAMPYTHRHSLAVGSDQHALMTSSSLASPVPEIRITFPDEVDEAGRRQSGRVVVVRVGEHSVGLEPLHHDLAAYPRHSLDRFDSLDLDSIGGLKEKDGKEFS